MGAASGRRGGRVKTDFEVEDEDVIAYRALGANIVHLRAAGRTTGWSKVAIG